MQPLVIGKLRSKKNKSELSVMNKVIRLFKKATFSYFTALSKAYSDKFYMYGSKCQKNLKAHTIIEFILKKRASFVKKD